MADLSSLLFEFSATYLTKRQTQLEKNTLHGVLH